MIAERHELPKLQSDFYRNHYYKVLRQLLISFSIILLLIVAIIYFVLFVKPVPYYAMTTSGQIIYLVPQEGS